MIVSSLIPAPVSHHLRHRLPLANVEAAAAAAESHHCGWDGLDSARAGQDIPAVGRVAAVCGALDALSHDRPFRRAGSVSAALQDIEAGAGKQFDPDLTIAFVEAIRSAYWRARDWEKYLSEEAESMSFAGASRLQA
jgi:HD-GYP domain-containing protein (c-di-GMP phosphodiesterase class II)